MTTASTPHSEARPPYTPGEHAPYTWSARFAVEPGLSLQEIVQQRLSSLVAGFATPELPISGAVIGAGEPEGPTTLVLGLHPSQAFHTPLPEHCDTIAEAITASQQWEPLPQTLPELRIIMGRRIGYDQAAAVHSLEAIRALTIAHGCGSVALTPADLFSLRYIPATAEQPAHVREHHEPAVIIEGRPQDLAALQQVAADMQQEQFVAEVTGVVTQVYDWTNASSLKGCRERNS